MFPDWSIFVGTISSYFGSRSPSSPHFQHCLLLHQSVWGRRLSNLVCSCNHAFCGWDAWGVCGFLITDKVSTESLIWDEVTEIPCRFSAFRNHWCEKCCWYQVRIPYRRLIFWVILIVFRYAIVYPFDSYQFHSGQKITVLRHHISLSALCFYH